MEEEKVNFDTAKLAKEKGFDWNTGKSYMSNGILFEHEIVHHAGEHFPFAPTQSLLQKWLREVHNIIVTSKPYQDDVSNETDEDIEFQILWENEVIDVKDSYNTFSDNTYYHSYEEALEIGLQEALNIIPNK